MSNKGKRVGKRKILEKKEEKERKKKGRNRKADSKNGSPIRLDSVQIILDSSPKSLGGGTEFVQVLVS